MVLMIYAFLITTQAHAFDVIKLHCLRQERVSNEIFLSEIHFTKGDTPTTFEGEVLSYSLQGSVKRYVSGYSLFSVNYNNAVVSGLTGDPNTRADGNFTLTRVNQKNSGVWNFIYNNKNGDKINADFKCIYSGTDPFSN